MPMEILCVVEGVVQGVGYRDFIDAHAKTHGLVGWVRNMPNGNVEMVLQGKPEILRMSVEVAHEGSVLARVDAVVVEWRTAEKIFDSFNILAS